MWTFGESGARSRKQARKQNRETPGVVEFTRARLGFFPDARQEELIRAGAKRCTVNCTRQSGAVAGVPRADGTVHACSPLRCGAAGRIADSNRREPAKTWCARLRDVIF